MAEARPCPSLKCIVSWHHDLLADPNVHHPLLLLAGAGGVQFVLTVNLSKQECLLGSLTIVLFKRAMTGEASPSDLVCPSFDITNTPASREGFHVHLGSFRYFGQLYGS